MTTGGRYTTGYQSDDEYSSKKYKQYSREDFKEIYCINQKSLEGLEKSRSTGFLFLGCLSSYQESPCRRRNTRRSTSTSTDHPPSSLFTSCYSSEQKFHTQSQEELLRQPARVVYYYHDNIYSSGSSFGGREIRERPRSVAGDYIPPHQAHQAHHTHNPTRDSLYNDYGGRRWVWCSELDRYVEAPQPLVPSQKKVHRYPSAPLNPTQIKHVSFYSPDYFTRSATSGSFDEGKVRKARWELMSGGVSQERLIDGRKTPPQILPPSLTTSRTSLTNKSQSTQTETFIARTGLPSEYLSLSPRVATKSRMVSQPTQTNGMIPPKEIEIESKLQKSPTEEEFHENYFPLFSPVVAATPEEENTTDTMTNVTVVSRSPTSMKSCTSSEGSYSLDKFKLAALLPLPNESNNDDVIEQANIPMETEEIISPPEMFQDEKKKTKKRKSLRAKSEERYSYKCDAATQSSISLHASLHDLSTLEDDDCGLYMESYTNGSWVYIGETEEYNTWTRHEPLSRTSSGDSTSGEKEFHKKYVALTHRMVHRKASGECYRRLGSNLLEITKRTTLNRTQTCEFGFRIHGSRPVVVSAVEAASPAEVSGLEVGDVIMSINGLEVLESSHSDVVRIASCVESLELELARTMDIIGDAASSSEWDRVVKEGILDKFNGLELEDERGRGKWVGRLFTLTPTSLKYSKSPNTPPLKILSLTKPSPLILSLTSGILTLSRGSSPLLLVTTDLNSLLEWKEQIAMTIATNLRDDDYIENCGKFVTMGPESVLNADCVGFLWKLGRRVKVWGRKYFVLKDAFFLVYGGRGGDETSALGATHLHGYRVQTVSILGGKRFAFELIPPEVGMRHYYLATDNENERKRWLAAFEYSIDRWINLSLNRF